MFEMVQTSICYLCGLRFKAALRLKAALRRPCLMVRSTNALATFLATFRVNGDTLRFLKCRFDLKDDPCGGTGWCLDAL